MSYNNNEAHSVLFENDSTNPYPMGDPNSEMQFYSGSYTDGYTQDGGYYDPNQTYVDQQYQQDYSFQQEGSNNVEINWLEAFGSGGLPGEPPLMEELGINFEHVKTKTFTVLNPFKTIDTHMMDDADLVGPLIFCLLLGFAMVFQAKVQFGYIYGVAMLGWLSMYGILNLMSEQGLDLTRTASVLGYCLLPIVLLGLIGVGIDLSEGIGIFLAPLVIAWSTYAASTIFVKTLNMQNQRVLIAYPIALLYTCFSLITIF